MIKGLTIQNTDLAAKINAVTLVVFGGLSATESLVLSKMIHYSANNQIALSVDISRQIQQELNITQSSFATTLFRLAKKNIIEKQGKNVMFNPVFANIQELDELRIKFSPVHKQGETS